MNKFEDEINTLELEILTVRNNIDEIDLQIEVNEIHANGDDQYFEWLKKAKTAKFHKVKRENKLKLELKFLNKAAHSKKDNKKNKNSEGNLIHQAMVEAQIKVKLKAEEEKTKRHQMSENLNLLIFKEFKYKIKELIGKSEYLRVIEDCINKIEGNK